MIIPSVSENQVLPISNNGEKQALFNSKKQALLIAIDGNEANIENRVGVNQFAFAVLWGIYKSKAKNKKLRVNKFLIFLSGNPRTDLPPETKWWRYEVFGPKRFWTWTGLVKRLYFGKPKPNVLLSLSHYGPGFSPIPFVISIMDLGFLRFPKQFTKKDFFQLKHWTRWSVKKAKKIIAISKFTEKDIIKTYGVGSEKIVVAPLGFQKIKDEKLEAKELSKKLKTVKEKHGIGGNYILYLGTLKPNKNIEGLVDAYHVLYSKLNVSSCKLVIAGKKGWLYQSIFEKVKQLGLENEIIFAGFVPDEEVPILMKGAKLFVMPSFWEGFGIPVLEAMDAGVPVVCSNAASLPEVAGEAALLVNPYNPRDIAEGIRSILTDQKLRQKLIEKGKEQVKVFSWEKCSKIILKTLLEVNKH